ncbi:glycosyl transferase [Tamlana nanhaiensis]|uniref:Glycosyl transferase n=1 Tax=Neotamlana nanhaiensis TaxID=1382798 RepID=A0A0D7W6S8_9FLAO|nr:glycosyltransferase family 2 protein [Tamlana nanhaiensis]KJD34816.1 glycosyl transferase [Tamlana nanhaiensis]
MLKLSGVIITYNEEKKIEKCLQSLIDVVDEIIVIDSLSTDNTKSICNKYNVTFIEQPFLGYKEQKQFGVDQASYDYIVALDADESLSETLKMSILNLKHNWVYDGYVAKRLNYFCGQWIKHTTWYPDKKLRVFDRRKAKWGGINPHDSVKLHSPTAKTGFLKGDILHETYQSYSEFNQRVEKFSSISAESNFKLGKKAPIYKIIFNPTWAFIQSYFLKLGFLDGLNGLIISVQTANIRFLKYIKLRELIKEAS